MNHYIKPIIPSLVLLLYASALWAQPVAVPLEELEPTLEHNQSTHVIVKVIDKYHYKDSHLDDEASKRILERYLEALDPNRFFFLASDIKAFSSYQDSLDDYLKSGRVDPAFQIFRIYRKRVEEAVTHAVELLEKDFDFSIDETYQYERSEVPWAESRTELDSVWRKRVKNDFLTLRLTDKSDEDIRKTLKGRYERLFHRVEQFDANDVYQSFINAFTLNLEPHTSYMSPSTSENFDISMRLSLEGIGAVLRSEDEYTVVQKTIVGGPAQLSGELQAGDRIVGVGQGLDGEIEDIIGWRLQDVVEKIRGPKGSVVRLSIIPKELDTGGKRNTITLVRTRSNSKNKRRKAPSSRVWRAWVI
jgi:carboxyl-terminal processing protease